MMAKVVGIGLEMTHITSAPVTLTKTNHTLVPNFKEGGKWFSVSVVGEAEH